MLNKQKIVLLKPDFDDFSIENQLLSSTNFQLIVVQKDEDLLPAIQDEHLAAIITIHVPIRTEIIRCIGPSCRVVTRLGVGFDVIDVKLCRERNLTVCYVPDYGTNDVADHAVALLFAAHRRLSVYQRSIVQNQIWNYQIVGNDLHSLKTRNLGIIGLGRIGLCFARKIEPFVQQLFTYDPTVSSANSSINEIFEKCHIISLHIPYNKENHHFLSKNSFDRMKQQPIIINVSRGGLIDTQALVQALRLKQISYAALDVLENEPEIDPDLIQMDRIQLTPHAAWFTVEAENSLRTKAIEDILRVFNGLQPIYPVPL